MLPVHPSKGLLVTGFLEVRVCMQTAEGLDLRIQEIVVKHLPDINVPVPSTNVERRQERVYSGKSKRWSPQGCVKAKF